MNEKEDILHNGGLEGLRNYQVFKRRIPSFRKYNNENVKSIDRWHFKICKNNNPRLPYKYWISVVGHLKDGTIIQSSPILDIESPRILITENSRYRLEANSDLRKITPHENFSKDELNKFLNGFPKDWMNIFRIQLEKIYGKNLLALEDATQQKEIVREIDKLYETTLGPNKAQEEPNKGEEELSRTTPKDLQVGVGEEKSILVEERDIVEHKEANTSPKEASFRLVQPSSPIQQLTPTHLVEPCSPLQSPKKAPSQTLKTSQESKVSNSLVEAQASPKEDVAIADTPEDFFVDQAAVESLLDINRRKNEDNITNVEWLPQKKDSPKKNDSPIKSPKASKRPESPTLSKNNIKIPSGFCKIMPETVALKETKTASPSPTSKPQSKNKTTFVDKTEDLFTDILQDSLLLKGEFEKEQKKPSMENEQIKNDSIKVDDTEGETNSNCDVNRPVVGQPVEDEQPVEGKSKSKDSKGDKSKTPSKTSSATKTPNKASSVSKTMSTAAKSQTPTKASDAPSIDVSQKKPTKRSEQLTAKDSKLDSSFISLNLESKSEPPTKENKSLIIEDKNLKKRIKRKAQNLEKKQINEENIKSYIKDIGEEIDYVFETINKPNVKAAPDAKNPIDSPSTPAGSSSVPSKEGDSKASQSSSSDDGMTVSSSQVSVSSVRSGKKSKRKKITMPRDFRMIARKLKKEFGTPSARSPKKG